MSSLGRFSITSLFLFLFIACQNGETPPGTQASTVLAPSTTKPSSWSVASTSIPSSGFYSQGLSDGGFLAAQVSSFGLTPAKGLHLYKMKADFTPDQDFAEVASKWSLNEAHQAIESGVVAIREKKKNDLVSGFEILLNLGTSFHLIEMTEKGELVQERDFTVTDKPVNYVGESDGKIWYSLAQNGNSPRVASLSWDDLSASVLTLPALTCPDPSRIPTGVEFGTFQKKGDRLAWTAKLSGCLSGEGTPPLTVLGVLHFDQTGRMRTPAAQQILNSIPLNQYLHHQLLIDSTGSILIATLALQEDGRRVHQINLRTFSEQGGTLNESSHLIYDVEVAEWLEIRDLKQFGDKIYLAGTIRKISPNYYSLALISKIDTSSGTIKLEKNYLYDNIKPGQTSSPQAEANQLVSLSDQKLIFSGFVFENDDIGTFFKLDLRE